MDEIQGHLSGIAVSHGSEVADDLAAGRYTGSAETPINWLS